jgi:translation initiation factor 2D
MCSFRVNNEGMPSDVPPCLVSATCQAAGKGKLLEVLQHYGDTLWQGLGRQAVPNDGFQQGFVAPLDLIAAATAEVESAAAAGADAAAGDLEQLSISSSSRQPGQTQQDQWAAAAVAAGSSDGGGCGSNGGSSAADMDDLLERSLVQALLKSIKEADLPLNSSSLWSQHITSCRPVGSTLDVKKSSHKKMSKFLQVG